MGILPSSGSEGEMLAVIAYDVNTSEPAGSRRLRRVAKVCVNYGQRVQNSVFEFVGDASTLAKVRHELLKIMDTDKDSLRIYRIGNRYADKIEQYGAKRSYEAEGFIAL